MRHDGNPPAPVEAATQKTLTLAGLRDAYVAAKDGKLERATLDGIELHFSHLVRLLTADRLMHEVTHADLQGYVNTRSKEWIDPDVYRKKRLAKLAQLP